MAMVRPTSKAHLLDGAENEFNRLVEAAASVGPGRRSESGVCEEWSVKDILAHLDAWNRMFLVWETSAIEHYRDEDLFTRKRYPSTGSTSVALYAGSATASHYAWARGLVEKWCKRIEGPGPEEAS